MALQKWRKISEQVLFNNSWWEYRKDAFQLPHGKEGVYHYVHTNGASLIIPIMENGNVVVVKQYRYLCDRESVEFPCGGVKNGVSYEETARHELGEETGYTAKTLDEIGEFNPYNGVTDEICKVYVARDLQFIGGVPDETEQFEVLQLPPEEIDNQIKTGSIWDGMMMAAWQIARVKSHV